MALIKRIVHNDLEHLELVLKDAKDKFKTKLVIIDGGYSQDGDLSRLPEIIACCRKHGALLMVDDAHGIGVMGRNGLGTAEHLNCLGEIDILTGTFSKSFGCVGGVPQHQNVLSNICVFMLIRMCFQPH